LNLCVQAKYSDHPLAKTGEEQRPTHSGRSALRKADVQNISTKTGAIHLPPLPKQG
jgi:hypothetical protein